MTTTDSSTSNKRDLRSVLAEVFQIGKICPIRIGMAAFMDKYFPFTSRTGFNVVHPAPLTNTAPDIAVLRGTEDGWLVQLAVFLQVEDTVSLHNRATAFISNTVIEDAFHPGISNRGAFAALGITKDNWFFYSKKDSDSPPELCAEGGNWLEDGPINDLGHFLTVISGTGLASQEEVYRAAVSFRTH